uniref:DYW domain-containing protein n=1 Tax=Kalanchoe fedtschenkoi TaxID=63787 RepID=A0A7N0VNJ9_KALFE
MSTAPRSCMLPLNPLQDSSSATSSAQRWKLFHVRAASTLPSSKMTVGSVPESPFGNLVKIDVLGQKRVVGADESLELLKLSEEFCDCRQMHGRLIKLGALGSDSLFANRLVVMYSRNEGLSGDARKVFEGMSDRRIQSYAAMIGSFCRVGNWDDLFWVLGLMIGDGMWPDKYMVPTLLKACSAKEELLCGKMVHGYVVRRKIGCDVYVGNGLIDFYANCGDLRYSKNVFDSLSDRDVVSWTALVSAYMDVGLVDEAVEVFRSMQVDGVRPDLISWNALAAGYAKNGDLDLALECFEEMQEKGLTPNVNSWNGVISACVHNGHFEDALEVFRVMVQAPMDPNVVTVVSVLQACAGLTDLDLGRALHAHSLRHRLDEHAYFNGSLIDMYSKCGRADYALIVFGKVNNRNTAMWNEIVAARVNAGEMEEALELVNMMETDNVKPDVITFNTILAGYARNGQKTEALKLLSKMVEMDVQPNIVSCNVLISGFQQRGLSIEALKLIRAMQSADNDFLPDGLTLQPNSITVTSALAAFADLSLHRKGKEIHGYILKNLSEANMYVLSALVDMYGKCNDMSSATKVFGRAEERSTVLWNVLMAGLIKNKRPDEALESFMKMLAEGHKPSSVTFVILLSACADLAALGIGKELHSLIVKSQHGDSAAAVSSALIDLYAKCGCIVESRKVFDSELDRDIALWNSMISAYTFLGLSDEAIALYKDMEASGPSPDHITLMSLLSACARDGLVDEGWRYFRSMDEYGIQPSVELYTCMVAILGSAGLLEEAHEFIRQMPFEADACMWSTLLQACRLHSNPEIGERAANALFELEPENASNYILLANIYVSSGLWDAAQKVRNLIRGRKLLTVKECSYVNIGATTIHAFKGGNISDFRLDETLDTWDKLAAEMEETGYFPNDPVLDPEQEVDPFSCLHTEKLAICFGIMASSGCQRDPIRVSKNIRMCIDCHTSAKMISRICRREIHVKDVGLYHQFKEGKCSCRDRW